MPLHACRSESASYMWSSVPSMGDTPPHGCCHSLVNYKDEFLILFGGGALHYAYNDVHFFDLKKKRWSYKETINSEVVAPRISHSAVVYGDNMYVYGGQDVFLPTFFSDVLVLNLITFTWARLHQAPPEPEGPGDRRLHTAHIYRNHMYVLMGDPCNTPPNFWYLDLNTHKWYAVRSPGTFGKPVLPLLGHSAQVEGDHLYVFGGYRARNEPNTSSMVYSNSLFCYHFPTNTWREVLTRSGPRPAPRYASAMVVVSGRVYIHGGDTDGELYFDDFWCIDTAPAVSRWVDLTVNCGMSRPSARSGHASALAQGSFFVFGGELPGDANVVYYSNRLYHYPLGLFTHLPLAELSSRWLAKSNQVNLRVLHDSIPFVAKRILAQNTPIQTGEEGDELMPCMRMA
ncbi:kelch domain-containing protein 3 [Trypanosoma grayi]|uniref:kelch domain-containing protein 3 n=1 Tax=Trypanosoma grayi TaxID=71804 RepID=UPI0004F44D5C|nr:kelch domain-containing protein 3 [Trypanosoma grayi]KEG15422.1 kelch domain-containing protein 3 [Trypanosoma grayi]